MSSQWHAQEVDEVLLSLESGVNGLSAEETQKRLSKFGPNELAKRKRISALQILLLQFKNIFVIMLLFAIAISVAIGWFESQTMPENSMAIETYVDSIAIGTIVVFNVIVGFVQEFRSEKAIEAMQRLIAPKARALRGGKEVEIYAKEIVPGDVIMLEAGDRVPADGRLIETIDFSTDEAALTGESSPVRKDTEALAVETAVADRKNMVFMGTSVVYGRGKAVVVATAMETQFGRISEMVQAVEEEEIPLKRRLDRFAKNIGLIVIIAVIAILILSWTRNGSFEITFLLTAVALAVSAVPEGLPAAVTVTLALGARELSKRNAVIRRLASVETLGSTTVICSDKTGTLTKGEMTLRRIIVNNEQFDVTGTGFKPEGEYKHAGKTISPLENESLNLLLRIGILCNNSSVDGSSFLGDPTETALIVAALKAGLKKKDIEMKLPRIAEIPFSSERKRMTTIHGASEGRVAYVKGSVESVLQLCGYVYQNGDKTKLNDPMRKEILANNEEMATQALRVLAMAYRALPDQVQEFNEESVENDLVFVGLVGLLDPPRQEAKEAVRLCRQARIKVVMITGDHKLTAIAVARELEIIKDGNALTGEELDRKNDEEFYQMVETISVYARVSPEHKLRIVKALKKKGHIVAMTGDGVNDAPAVKQADIGISMGITGTDVTKEASDMVLADDNFATIVTAVEGGRIIYDNILKFIRFLIALNFAELLLISSFALIGLPIPLLPAMILWLNLVTDGPPALALSVDPPTENVMLRPPRSPKEGILHGTLVFVLASTALNIIVEIVAFWWGFSIRGSIETARTLAFLTACFYELVVIWNCRSLTRNAFRVGFFNNKPLLIAVTISILSTIAVVYVPALELLFQTVPLEIVDWAIVIVLSLTGFLVLPEVFIRKNHTQKGNP